MIKPFVIVNSQYIYNPCKIKNEFVVYLFDHQIFNKGELYKQMG